MNYDFVKQAIEAHECPAAAVILSTDDYPEVGKIFQNIFDWDTPKERLLGMAFDKYLQTKLDPKHIYVVLNHGNSELEPVSFSNVSTIEDLGNAWIQYALAHKLNLRAAGFLPIEEYIILDDRMYAEYLVSEIAARWPELQTDIVTCGDVILTVRDSYGKGRYINVTQHYNRYLNGERFDKTTEEILQFIELH